MGLREDLASEEWTRAEERKGDEDEKGAVKWLCLIGRQSGFAGVFG